MGNNDINNKELIIKAVQNFYNKNGKIVIRDLRVKNGLPNTERMTRLFGTFQNLLLEANITIPENKKHNFNRVELTDEKLLDDLKLFVDYHLKSNLYLPNNNEVDANKDLQSCSTYIKRFQSFENAYKLIGYDVYSFNNNAMERDMIEKYKIMCEKVGHILNSREITNLCKIDGNCIYATETYNNHFESISNMQKLCGFIPTNLGRSITRQESIMAIQRLAKELNHTPTISDIDTYDYIPSQGYFITEFGSWKNALLEAGLNLNNFKEWKTRDGEVYPSSYEYKFALVLKKFFIKYDREYPYRYVLDNFNRKYRFDFTIYLDNRKYYVEIFGITGNDIYENRKQEKINICKSNNVPMIYFSKEDIYGKTHKQVYKLLLEKINTLFLEVA